jgi:hypothetical protein
MIGIASKLVINPKSLNMFSALKTPKTKKGNFLKLYNLSYRANIIRGSQGE